MNRLLHVRRRARSRDGFLAIAVALLAGVAAAPAPSLLFDLRSEKIVDMSYPFDDRTIYWPTTRSFQLTHDFSGKTEAGYFYASNSFCASEHGGTHLDAPSHFSESGLTADRIPPRALIAPVVVIDVRRSCAADPDHAATVEEVKAFEAAHGSIPRGAVAILFTGWGARWPDKKRYLGDDTPGDASHLRFPGFSPEAAAYLANERHVAGLGIDTASIDRGVSKDFKAHQIAGAANVYNLENLAAVDRLPPKGGC